MSRQNPMATTNHQSLINATTPRSYLFVPATRTERIAKALASNADAVIIDLEDAVSDADKVQARIDLQDWFTTNLAGDFSNNLTKNQLNPSNKPIWIRINNIDGLETLENRGAENFQQDIRLCQQLQQQFQQQLSGIVLPKVENGETVEHAHQATNLPIIIQVETARAISKLRAITSKVHIKGLQAISYGKLDLCNELNMRLGSQAQIDFINHLRYQLLLTSKASGLQPPIESIYPNFKDHEGLEETANYVADLGFAGMLAIHPVQIEHIHQAFAPSDEELAFANKVVSHHQTTGESAYAIDGVMVDLPVIRQCDRLINQATE